MHIDRYPQCGMSGAHALNMEKLRVSDPDFWRTTPQSRSTFKFWEKIEILFIKKMQHFYSCASKKSVQATGETSSTHKENIQHFKT
jgi:hypothetical protein